MISHARFRSMLVFRDELPLPDQIRLNRHLDTCADCRREAAALAEDRLRLRTLTQIRPPAELRETVLTAADTTRTAFSVSVPLVVSLLPLPLTLVFGLLAAAYGSAAFLFLLIAILGYAAAAELHVRRWERSQGLTSIRFSSHAIGPLLQALLVDVAGAVAGALVFVGCLLLLIYLAAHLPSP